MKKAEISVTIYGAVEILAEMPLLAILWKDAQRGPNGMFTDPPRLFVVRHNLKMDKTDIHPVEWAVAETLAPEALGRVVTKINEARDRLYREHDARLRGKADPIPPALPKPNVHRGVFLPDGMTAECLDELASLVNMHCHEDNEESNERAAVRAFEIAKRGRR